MPKLLLFIIYVFTFSCSAMKLKGELTQGSLLRGKVEPGSKVWLNGEPLRVSPQGHFVFGFGRDAKLEHELSWQPAEVDKLAGNVEQASGQASEQKHGSEESRQSHSSAVNQQAKQRQSRKLSLTKRTYNEQHINGLPQKMVTPPKEVLERIRHDNKQVAEARRLRDERIDFAQDFVWPSEGPISGVYGSRRILNGVPKRPHFGVDVAAPTGTAIVAPADGIVTLWHPDMYYSGGTMIIDHGHGVSSTFLHMSKSHVSAGSIVKQGQLVGEIGATGRVTGAHLDWRMNWHHERVDPALLVPKR